MAGSKDSKPTVIIVTGAWMSEFHTQPAKPVFEQAGYRFKAVKIPSVGVQEPKATFTGDVDAICNQISAETASGNDVCLILHSYSGIPGRESLSKFLSTHPKEGGDTGKVTNLIFIAAQLDNFDKEIFEPFYKDALRFEEGYNHLTSPREQLFNDLSDEEARPFVDALQPQTYPLGDTNIGDPTGKLGTEQNLGQVAYDSSLWKQVHSTYIVCLRDQGLRVGYQETEPVNEGMDIVRMDCGHCPMISQPKNFVDVVEKILAGHS